MENVLGPGLVRQPRTVLFGPGQRRSLAGWRVELQRKVLVVTDERNGHHARLPCAAGRS